MTESINEEVSVVAIYNASKSKPLPWKLKWRNRCYTFSMVDLCHPVWEGKTLHYIYSLCDGTTYFNLDLDTRAQKWFLREISDGLAN